MTCTLTVMSYVVLPVVWSTHYGDSQHVNAINILLSEHRIKLIYWRHVGDWCQYAGQQIDDNYSISLNAASAVVDLQYIYKGIIKWLD